MTSMEVLRTGVPVVAAVAGDASSATHRRGVRLARGAEDLRAATTGVVCAVRAAPSKGGRHRGEVCNARSSRSSLGEGRRVKSGEKVRDGERVKDKPNADGGFRG